MPEKAALDKELYNGGSEEWGQAGTRHDHRCYVLTPPD